MGIGRPRWCAKKLARRALLELAWASGSLAIGRAVGQGQRARALTYHRFGPVRRDPFRVSEAAFECQMAWLAERGLAVSLERLEAFLAGRGGVPAGAVLVTIDDGSESLLSRAAPILARHRIPAVAFVCPGLVGKRSSSADEPERYLAWDELAELVAAGVELGSHAMSHRSLGSMDGPELRDEVLRSRETIERRLGVEVRAFAYPFGTRTDFNATTARALRDAGYRIAFTSQHGAIRPGLDPISLPRVKVEGGEGARAFRLLCSGGMDGWRAVDAALWRLQRPAAAASRERSNAGS